MFSGKREKALLEEELAALRETEKRERELLHKIAGQKDTAEEQFAPVSYTHLTLPTILLV